LDSSAAADGRDVTMKLAWPPNAGSVIRNAEALTDEHCELARVRRVQPSTTAREVGELSRQLDAHEERHVRHRREEAVL